MFSNEGCGHFLVLHILVGFFQRLKKALKSAAAAEILRISNTITEKSMTISPNKKMVANEEEIFVI
jgi:hypothetical protein